MRRHDRLPQMSQQLVRRVMRDVENGLAWRQAKAADRPLLRVSNARRIIGRRARTPRSRLVLVRRDRLGQHAMHRKDLLACSCLSSAFVGWQRCERGANNGQVARARGERVVDDAVLRSTRDGSAKRRPHHLVIGVAISLGSRELREPSVDTDNSHLRLVLATIGEIIRQICSRILAIQRGVRPVEHGLHCPSGLRHVRSIEIVLIHVWRWIVVEAIDHLRARVRGERIEPVEGFVVRAPTAIFREERRPGLQLRHPRR